MTVTVKRSSVVLNGQTVGFDAEYGLKFVWVMELAPAEASATGEGDAPGTGDTRGPAEATEATEATGASDTGDGTDTDGSVSRAPTQSPALRGLWISAISHNEKAPGNTDVTTGWIGLRTTDAQWLYEQLSEGAVVEIRNPGPTPAPTPTSTRGSIGTGSGR